MRRQRVPNDNSCLFTAIAFCISGEFEAGAALDLRRLCTNHIKKYPDKYTSDYLGKSNKDYCEWLMLDTSWGGEVEIVVISEILNVEISVVQQETLTILTYSPPRQSDDKPEGATCRVYLLYTGLHYDALVGEDSHGNTGCFSTDENHDDFAIVCARKHKPEWEENLRKRMSKRIKCLGCDAILQDAASFQRHCSEVEHDPDFCFECEDIEVVDKL